jgi:hypothetical protein
MRITIESTERIVELNGTPARIWEGETAAGVKVVCLVAQIAARTDQDQSELEADLQECHAPPSADGVKAFDLRMFLP